MAESSKRTIYSLQMLRFVAAFIVVISHVDEKMHAQALRYKFSLHLGDVLGSFGVRIFFVISGFIMVWICFSKGVEDHPSPGKFMWNRIQRIVPVYWICTTFYLLYYVCDYFAGGKEGPARIAPAYVLKSYLFIPVAGLNGKMRPLLDVGWTLNYEMFFYALFAAGLFTRSWRGVATAAALLAASTLLSPSLYVLKIWTDYIVLYFVAGMLIGALRIWLRHRHVALPHTAWAFPVAAVLAIVGACWPGHLTPILAVAACALCALTANIEPRNVIEKTMVRLGDASFSLYLVHMFVMLAVGIAWRQVFGGRYVFALGGTEIVLSLIAGWLFYKHVETHVGTFVQSRFRMPSRAVTVPAMSLT
jgi:exopolysaccharide production protein ExoZ